MNELTGPSAPDIQATLDDIKQTLGMVPSFANTSPRLAWRRRGPR